MNNDVLNQPAPQISSDEAAQIVLQVYGLEGTLKPLVAERDCNFALTTVSGERYVLKFSQAAEDPGVLDLQHQALLHLQDSAPEVPAPRLVHTLEGQTSHTQAMPDGSDSQMRMVSWLSGKIYNEVSHTPSLRHSLGAMTARLDKGLRGFSHPQAVHDLKWRMEQAGDAVELLEHIPDLQQRALAEKVLAEFTTNLAPRLATLRGQIIHNDASDCNVLVDEQNPQRVSGIIDFGDMTYSALINGLAVACAYAMLDSADPLTAATTASK
jgi:Ser/Thr protein kinase RdoA (MazF antagonist)